MFPRVHVDLRQPPEARWRFMDAAQCASLHALADTYLKDLGSLAEIAEQIAPIAAEHLDASTLAELRGLSQHAEIDEARLLLANLYYDAFRILIGCTAFAIDAPTGPIHARNLDWWAPNRLLTSTTWITAFEYGAMGPFETVGWPGMIGAFSGIAKGRFAVTMNAVVSREPAEPAASIAMLIRHAFETCADFDAAVALLSATKITADCLLLVTGVREGELIVIERTSSRAELRTAENGILVVTNDYRAMPGEVPEHVGELARTADARFLRAHQLTHWKRPMTPSACFEILSDAKVRMDMTVQQMFMHAASGTLDVRDPRGH